MVFGDANVQLTLEVLGELVAFGVVVVMLFIALLRMMLLLLCTVVLRVVCIHPFFVYEKKASFGEERSRNGNMISRICLVRQKRQQQQR